MVTIAHVSDTHLGKRPDDVRDIPAIDRRYRPLEDDFYYAWKLAVKEILDRKDEIDLVVHSGDFFDSPWSQNPYPPPEAARNVAAATLEELQKAGLPVAIIEGNHGCYLSYRVSTLNHYAIVFDNVHVFTYWDFVDAFKQHKPLKKDFEDLTFYAFPYVDPRFLESVHVLDAYRQWIRNIELDPNRVNLAAAHGMQVDNTLDANILNTEFEYIALGHDHVSRKIAGTAWYAGSTERWSFREASGQKCFLLVQAERNREPDVQPIPLPSRRLMIDEDIAVNREDTAAEIVDKLRNVLEKHKLTAPFDYETAARVKIAMEGSTSYETLTGLYAALEVFKHEGLTAPDLNVVQLKVGRALPDRAALPPTPSYIDLEYLIEDPEEELRTFLQKKEVGETYDLDLMVQLFKDALKKVGGSS
jgi:DNA repair exonuclease SbcCD nuclease subunit